MSPLAHAVLDFCRHHLAAAPARPLIVGVQGPQGAGKTTVTRALIDALPAVGLSGTAVSVDDFYMTRAGQLAMANAHPGHPLLEHRGYPGTHDISLGTQTLAALKRIGEGGDGQTVAVPVYDKSAHGGRGDRTPEAEWRRVSGPLDLVFVEGWMLGFEPVDEATLESPWLIEPNRALADYAAWHAAIDLWVILRAADPEYVLTWRVEAEEKMKASGKPGLSRADIEDYIRRFLPAYRTWGGAPRGVAPGRILHTTIGMNRSPV